MNPISIQHICDSVLISFQFVAYFTPYFFHSFLFFQSLLISHQFNLNQHFYGKKTFHNFNLINDDDDDDVCFFLLCREISIWQLCAIELGLSFSI